jgi:hypothetical protein
MATRWVTGSILLRWLDGIADPGGISEDAYRQVHDGSGKCARRPWGKRTQEHCPADASLRRAPFKGFCVPPPLPALARATHAPEPMAGLSAALWAKTAPAASAGSAGHVGSRPVDLDLTKSDAARFPPTASISLSSTESRNRNCCTDRNADAAKVDRTDQLYWQEKIRPIIGRRPCPQGH